MRGRPGKPPRDWYDHHLARVGRQLVMREEFTPAGEERARAEDLKHLCWSRICAVILSPEDGEILWCRGEHGPLGMMRAHWASWAREARLDFEGSRFPRVPKPGEWEAHLRWLAGEVVEEVVAAPCPSCRGKVPAMLDCAECCGSGVS